MKILREILWPLAAVFAAFVVGGIIVLLIGDNPFQTFYQLIGNSFGSLNDLGYTLFIATPLIFTGLAVAVAFVAIAWFTSLLIDPRVRFGNA